MKVTETHAQCLEAVVGCANATDDVSNSVVLVDKPAGWTSFEVIRWLRRRAATRKVGHAGTLDPMATGLLVCMTGRCTKLARVFLEMEKEYEGTLRLGQTTPSFDADTAVDRSVPADHVTRSDVEAAAHRFRGELVQQTPPFSAVKVRGERLHRRARRGDLRPGPPRVVTVSEFEILAADGCDVSFRLVCSKGTYVRALVQDLGQKLGVGAHLVQLRRVRIGEYRVSEAIRIEEAADGLASNRFGGEYDAG